MPRKNLLSLLESMAVTLVNLPSRRASIPEIASYIQKRGLYHPYNDELPLEKQIEVTASNLTSEDFIQQITQMKDKTPDILELKDSFNYSAVDLVDSLDAYFGYQNMFFNKPPLVNTISDEGDRAKVPMKAAEVVCILSSDQENLPSGHKKTIYVLRTHENGAKRMEIYRANGSFKMLRQKIDPAPYFLAIISDSVMVNVTFFKKGKNREVLSQLNPETYEFPAFPFSTSTNARKYEGEFDYILYRNNELNCLRKNYLIQSKKSNENGF